MTKIIIGKCDDCKIEIKKTDFYKDYSNKNYGERFLCLRCSIKETQNELDLINEFLIKGYSSDLWANAERFKQYCDEKNIECDIDLDSMVDYWKKIYLKRFKELKKLKRKI